MRASIIGYFTKPGFHLNFSPELYRLLIHTIKEKILDRYPIPKSKVQTFQIMLDAEIETNNVVVRQMTKTLRGEYLRFEIRLPYYLIVENKQLNIPLFISFLMGAIAIALMPYQKIGKEVYKEVEKQLINETYGKEIYVYKSKQNFDIEDIVANVMKKFPHIRTSRNQNEL